MKQQNLFETKLYHPEPELRLTRDGVEEASEYIAAELGFDAVAKIELIAKKKVGLLDKENLTTDEMRQYLMLVDGITNSRTAILSQLRVLLPNVCCVHIGEDGTCYPALDGGGKKPDGFSIMEIDSLQAVKRQTIMGAAKVRAGIDRLKILDPSTYERLDRDAEKLVEAVKQITS